MAEETIRQRKRYLSYLLRLWQQGGGEQPHGDPPQWRASLESPESGERRGFASLGDLLEFLEEEIGSGGQGSQVQAEEG